MKDEEARLVIKELLKTLVEMQEEIEELQKHTKFKVGLPPSYGYEWGPRGKPKFWDECFGNAANGFQRVSRKH